MDRTSADITGPGAEDTRSAAVTDLPNAMYDELRRLARGFLSRQPADHTLQPTALVHEAYLRLFNKEGFGRHSRIHFIGLAARAMRFVLIDHARRRAALTRGGGAKRVPLDDTVASYEARAIDLIALDEAIENLGAIEPRMGRMIELRFFGGLTLEETAAALEVSSKTVRRDWAVARAWLHGVLNRGGDES